jgi:hypothetical protein
MMFDFFALGRVVSVQLPPVPQPRCLPRLTCIEFVELPGFIPSLRKQPVGLLGGESRC